MRLRMIIEGKEEEILACTSGHRVVPITEMSQCMSTNFWEGGESRWEET